MPIHLIHDLQRLEDDLLLLSGRVEAQFHAAIVALQKRDPVAAKRIIAEDDAVDQAEVKLEEDCLKVLALHQPVARDLRQVVVILKINSEIERIADMAVVVSRMILELETSPTLQLPQPVFEMAALAEQMVADAIQAFLSEDSALARKCLEAVGKAVGLEQQAKSEMIERLAAAGAERAGMIQAFEILHAFRRVTARCANMAEDIIYMLDGEIVRHMH